MNESDDKKWLRRFSLIGGIVIALWGTSWIALICWSPENEWTQRGLFGDMFGAINALFSGLAFAGIMVTIWMQREDLRAQQEEVRKQNETLAKQQFEATLFQMLQLLSENVNQFEYDARESNWNDEGALEAHLKSPPVYKGREGFRALYREFTSQIGDVFAYQNEKDAILEIDDAWKSWMHEKKSDLGHYFRFVYTIIKFIDDSRATDKQFYIDVVHSQLSTSELGLLYYNCIYEFEKNRLRPLIIKYDLDKTLDWGWDLADPTHGLLLRSKAFE